MKIPFFNYPELYRGHRDNLLKIFDDIASKGAFIMQSELQEFEEKLSKYVGGYVLGVGNATDALEMLVSISDIKSFFISIYNSVADNDYINHADDVNLVDKMKKEVFNIDNNAFTYNQAKKVCKAYACKNTKNNKN